MTYVGAFATSELCPDLLVIESIHRPPRDTIKLCRLSDGHRFSLNPSRVRVLDEGWKDFEKHMHDEVKKYRLAQPQPQPQPHAIANEYLDDKEAVIAEYSSMIEETSSDYRLLPLITYIIHREYERSYYRFYTAPECWNHVQHICDIVGVEPPTLKVVRARLGVFSKHRQKAFRLQSGRC